MRRQGAWRFGLLVAGIVAFAGCGDDDGDPTAPPPAETGLSEQEEETAQEIAETFSALFQIGSLISQTVRGHAQGGLPAPAALRQQITCPEVDVITLQQNLLQFEIDFGAGCTMANGVEAAGSLTATWRASLTAPDSIAVEFSGFSLDGSTVTGTLSAVGEMTTWTYGFVGSIAGGDESWDLEASLGLDYDNAATPQNPDDDETKYTGGGKFDDGTTAYIITVSTAVVLTSACVYPETGKIAYQEDDDKPPNPVYTIDFGAGNCCTVHVSVGERGEDLDLCAIE